MVTPMPLISRGVSAFTNDDFSGAFPASHANNSTYGGSDYWRCATAPTGGANSGTLTQAVYLAYDLSGVPAGQRGQVLVHWDASAHTGDYDCTLTARPASNIPTSYTIDVNPAAGGGSAPSSGWTTKATVTSSAPYHSRQHLIDMTGNNWVRINVTAITGSASNNNVALNMDIHSAPSGATDSWLFVGDSITSRGAMYDDANGIGAVMTQQIATAKPLYYPVWEDAGVIGYTATDIQAIFSTWLAFFPGKYVCLNLGTNDANNAGAYLTNFQSKMQSMITAALNAGKTVVIPQIPWGGTANLISNVPTLNATITSLIGSNPGCIAGPKLYDYFSTHQSDIDPTDHIHPTDPQLATGNGYVNYRTQWVNWALTNIYNTKLSDLSARRRHRTGVF